MNLSDQIARGAKAQKLLEDPLLRESFEIAEKAILDMFKRAAEDQQIVRSKQLLTALTLVKRLLEQALTDGKIAERTLEEQKRGVSFLGDVREAWRKRNNR
jgi:hypothetical protein